jgi:predicted ATPase/DNA-binding SARP family transcriptional activator/Tfp pilus assembly protein PilF
MFGGLRVVQSDRTITRFQTQKTGALLAYLCLHKHSGHSREVLAEMLWPGADPVAVRNRLNQAASSLRRQLEPPGIIHGSVLITDQRTIRVNPESIETDVEEFTRFISRAETSGSPEEKQALLRKAIDLYVGDFLSGHYIEWITVEQLRLSDLYTGALFDLLDVSRDLGDVDQAIRAATLLLKDDPTDEGTHCDLMRLYLDAGRPAAAKRQFEELTRILAAEEETPSDEAYELNREASAKRSFSAKPMQVIVKETVPAEPFAKEESFQGLPSAPNRFVGREQDIARLRQMLTEESTRLITITGTGGCGKTRLALQLAHDTTDLFNRNAFFVPLADLREARQIDEAIASAIGIREAENIVRRLRQNSQTLLVLDNIEHLVEEGAYIVQSLLESVPTLKLLITSRCPLKIDAERCYQLLPLPSPSETIALDELSQNPSVALFVDRAQAALPDFQLTARNADVIRRLCQRLEGLPLAIELAASWAKTVAPAQMLSMLTDRFTLLESRRRDINARHRTMRAVIDSGVDLLPGDLKTLFHRLSVFHGGWTLESASFVCQRPDVLYAMESLVEQSLIQSESTGGDTFRFRMLDTLNDYADEHVPSAEKAETSNLHAEFFSKLSEEAAQHLGGRDQASWLNRLDLEIANLTAAFHWYLDHDLVESALVLANNLAAYWEFRGRAREGRRWMEAGLGSATAESAIDPKVLAEAKTHLARLIWIRGDFEEATRWHEQCLAEWKAIGDSRGISYAQINIQMEAHRNRDYVRSIELLNDNLQRATELDDQDILIRTWLSLGNTAVEMRRFEDARNHYEQSLKVARQAGNEHRIASALNNLGNLAMLSKQFALARHSLLQALAQFESLQAKSLATESLILLAKLERFEQNGKSAREWLARAWSQNPDETYNIQALFKEHAHAAASRGDQLLATTLLGFVERLREESGALNYDIEQEEFEDLVTTLRGALSDQVFQEAWTLGRTLEVGQAVNRIAV